MHECPECARKDVQLTVAATVACLAVGALAGILLAVAVDRGWLSRVPRIAVAIVRPVPDYLPDLGADRG